MWVWLALVGDAEAACERTATAQELGEKLDAAASSLAEGELSRFEEDLALVELAVECLADPIAPASAARLHRFWGIRTFARGKTEDAGGYFHTARALEPDVQLPVYPAAHPIQRAFRAERPSQTLEIEGPDGGALYVDGSESTQLDNAGVHLLQYRLPDASHLGYHTLTAGERPPWMAPERAPRSPLKPVLLSAGVVSLVAAVGFGIANGISAQGFQNAAVTSETDLRKRQRTTNTFAVATGIAGGVGIGLVVGGVLAPGANR